MNMTAQRERWARKLKTARAKKKMSQEELAREAGFTVSYIQKIETAAKGNRERFESLMQVIGNYEGKTA